MQQRVFIFLALLVSTAMAWADCNGICGNPYVNGGADVTWSFVRSTSTLTISGSGEMGNYDESGNRAPWHKEENDITVSIEHIVVENGVTSIGNYAFKSCKAISLTIPSSVKSIGSYVTANCTDLETITIDDGNTVYYSKDNTIIERNTSKLVAASKNTVIPSDVTSIGDGAFQGNITLTALTIPSSVTSIGAGAFKGCLYLTSVYVLATTPAALGSSAFDNNREDRMIYVPSGYLSAYQGADNWSSYESSLLGCSSCGTNVYYALYKNKLAIFGSGAMTDFSQGGAPWYSSRESITSAVIENGVTTIGDYAFQGCNNESLTTITISASVTSIGAQAFYQCTGLTFINIPASVTSIGAQAFNGCSGLSSLTVESENPTYDSRSDCNAIIEKLTNTLIAGCNSTVVPASVTSIGSQAFQERTSLASISIPDGVTSIGAQAFQQCSGLTFITIPSSVTSIGNSAFDGCTSLASVYVLATTPAALGTSAFNSNASERKIYVLTDQVETYQAAENWNSYESSITSLTEMPATASGNCGVNIDNCTWTFNSDAGILLISGNGAMADYTASSKPLWNAHVASISKVIINPGVTTIGDYAFQGCNHAKLVSIPIPSSVTTIGDYAFQGCSNLTSLTIPSNVTTIGDYAFQGCGNMASIIFADDSQLQTIGVSAFQGCSNLASLTIPSSVTTIGKSAFQGCESIASITFADDSQLQTIGVSAFSDCDNANLTSITIPSSVTSIGANAFEDCSNLVTVTIGSGVTSIGENAFYDCEKLAAVTFEEGSLLTTLGANVFCDCDKLASVTFADNSQLTTIGANAFNSLIGLESITIPSSVQTIGDHAFEGCLSLTTVDFAVGSRLQTIGVSAFEECEKLSAFTIGSGVTSIGENAFYDCTSVTDVYCYADPDPAKLTWTDDNTDDFMDGLDDEKTVCHVFNVADWRQEPFKKINVEFKGDLTSTVKTNQITEGHFAGYWSTYYNSLADMQAPVGIIVYKGVVSGTNLMLTEVDDRIVKAGQGVILKNTVSDDITLTVAENASGDDYSDNALTGVYAQTTISGSDYAGKYIYTLANEDNTLGFYQYYSPSYTANATLGAGKAFLALDAAVAAGARSFVFAIEETTGVNEELRMKNEEFAPAVYYNLDGRKLNGKPTRKGLYIRKTEVARPFIGVTR